MYNSNVTSAFGQPFPSVILRLQRRESMVHFLPLPFFYAIPLSGQYPVQCSFLRLAVKAASSHIIQGFLDLFWANATKLLSNIGNELKFQIRSFGFGCPDECNVMSLPYLPPSACSHNHPPHHIRLMAMRESIRAATIILLSSPNSPTAAGHSSHPYFSLSLSLSVSVMYGISEHPTQWRT